MSPLLLLPPLLLLAPLLLKTHVQWSGSSKPACECVVAAFQC